MEKYLVVQNAKFVVTGVDVANNRKFQLILPRGKHFAMHAVKSGENDDHFEDLLKIAVIRMKSGAFHMNPYCEINDEFVFLPRTLQQIMLKHPYPLSQGPVMLPIDCIATDDYEQHPIPKSISEVLSAKTVFSHDESQGCYEWSPVSIGVSAWGHGPEVPGYAVRDVKFCIQGAASTKDMGVVYTCELSQCIIRCPCNVCQDPRETCKQQCKAEVCRDCNSQCTLHEIKLARLFNCKTDHFTLVSQKMTKYQFANPYAGIPLNCDVCSKDVLEHQVLHLVWHVRCRFCRFEMRPFERKSVVSITVYKLAERIVKNLDAGTCSVCLLTCKDSNSRRKHEEIVHKGKYNGKYSCTKCEKSYSNKNALAYHEQKHEDIKFICSLCGFQSSTDRGLTKHSELNHGEKSQTSEFKCEKCGVSFSLKSNFNRHNRENHYESKVNFDYVEDLDSLKMIKCENCDKTFKRKSDLKRHFGSAHSEIDTNKKFKCPVCGKEFLRKFVLNRHMKTLHE